MKRIPINVILSKYEDYDVVKTLEKAIDAYCKRLSTFQRTQLYFVQVIDEETGVVQGYSINIPQHIDKVVVNAMLNVLELIYSRWRKQTDV